jgi:DNA-binding NtrC family response regulator
MGARGKVLIIDDDESMRIGCGQTLEAARFSAVLASDGEEGLERASRESFDVAVLDLKMPGLPGLEVLRRLRQDSPNLMVIIMTGYATIESAVDAIQLGAYNYLPKPFTPEALVAIVAKAASAGRRTLEDACVRQELERQMLSSDIIGRSEAMRHVLRLIRKAAPTDSTVLITGETGSGKEVVAREIHRLSARSAKPFVTVDCGTLVETLFESELFGHAKGAFSGAVDSTVGKIELAHGGTLFLDEIANIHVHMQASLLRVVQEREISKVGSTQKKKVDVRILSATNRDLPEAVREGNFREDLFYRLNVIHIPVPPLRDRTGDVPVLIAHYIRKLATERRRPVPVMSQEAMHFLERHAWPGNVRELINALEYAVVTAEGDTIGLGDLPYGPEAASQTSLLAGRSAEEGHLARMEQGEILRALQQFGGNGTRAAEFLGINRKTLREKIRKYNLKPQD